MITPTPTPNPPRPQLHSSWLQHLENYFQSHNMKVLKQFLLEEQSQFQVYPPNRLIFNALNSTALEQVKVVILGQDPYHGFGQAHGLSFSVPRGTKVPPSLLNIFQELQHDLGINVPQHGDLSAWTQQGVLLLNTALTVRARQANSHRGKGWEGFTDEVIKLVSHHQKSVVFILWGRNAKEKKNLIDSSKHLVLESAHPSPYSAQYGFFGSRPFSKSNHFLQNRGLTLVDWSLPN